MFDLLLGQSYQTLSNGLVIGQPVDKTVLLLCQLFLSFYASYINSESSFEL